MDINNILFSIFIYLNHVVQHITFYVNILQFINLQYTIKVLNKVCYKIPLSFLIYLFNNIKFNTYFLCQNQYINIKFRNSLSRIYIIVYTLSY